MEFFDWSSTRLQANLSSGLFHPRIADFISIVEAVRKVDLSSAYSPKYHINTPTELITSSRSFQKAYHRDPATRVLRNSSIEFRGLLQGNISTRESLYGSMILGMVGTLGGWAALGTISIALQAHKHPHYNLSTAITGGMILGSTCAYQGAKIFPPSLFVDLNPERSDPKTLEAFLERVDAQKTLAKIRNKQIK